MGRQVLSKWLQFDGDALTKADYDTARVDVPNPPTRGTREHGYTPNPDEPDGWTRFANCLGVDPDLFFPTRGEDCSEAKAVCRGCEVQAQCLVYALDNGEKWGVWGGCSERERRKLRKQRRVS